VGGPSPFGLDVGLKTPERKRGACYEISKRNKKEREEKFE
jgi:hypothetical protein